MARLILLATILVLEGHVSAHVGAWHEGALLDSDIMEGWQLMSTFRHVLYERK